MTLHEELSFGKDFLGNIADVERLLAHVLEKRREFIFAYPEAKISTVHRRRFRSLLQKYRDGVPLPYLLKSAPFCGLDLYVDKRCLIPRPETEIIVELAKQEISALPKNSPFTLLDIGTGSGAIAVALASQFPKIRVVGSDISKDALSVAKHNVKKFGLQKRISLAQSNLLQKFLKNNEHFDGIVANLPYISEKERRKLPSEILKYEPHVALFGGEDGLHLYEKLFAQIVSLPKFPKFIIGEFGFGQRKKISTLLNKYFVHGKNGMAKIFFHKDLASIERIFIVKWY